MVRNKDAHAGGPNRRPIDARVVRGLVWCATAVAVLSIVSAAATAESPQSPGQQPAAEPGDAAIDTVTVEARRRQKLVERQVGTFVSSITMPGRDESIARWQVPICPLVAGLSLEQGTFVFERISQVANEAGVPLGPRDCTPNLRIVMTREPEALLKRLWDKNHRMFNTDRGVGGIKRTIRTPAPVRVFYNACSMPSQIANTSANGLGSCGEGGIPDSKLRWSTVRVLYSAIIVVDKRQTEQLELAQLTDYIAMISFAQIRSHPDLGAAPTILRLFHESDALRPQGLSPWDRAFLKSLYGTDQSRVTQLSEIKHRMKLDLAR